MSDTIYDDCYVVMSQYGVERMTKKKGSLKRGEISVRIRIRVPSHVFDEPTVSAEINVPESCINRPDVVLEPIEAEIAS